MLGAYSAVAEGGKDGSDGQIAPAGTSRTIRSHASFNARYPALWHQFTEKSTDPSLSRRLQQKGGIETEATERSINRLQSNRPTMTPAIPSDRHGRRFWAVWRHDSGQPLSAHGCRPGD